MIGSRAPLAARLLDLPVMSESLRENEAPILSFKDLKVWQLGVELVVLVRNFTLELPASEQFQITAQLRRASVSIPTNIAEGRGRNTRKDYAHFVAIARGSACEVWTLLEVCERLKIGAGTRECKVMVERIIQMLWKLGKSLSRPGQEPGPSRTSSADFVNQPD